MRELRPSLIIFFILTIITGLIYPMLVTGISKTFFSSQANGSLLYDGNRIVGSELVGQSFTDPKYFWGRPSATSPQPYNAASSSGSNQGPTNPGLVDAVKGRIEALRTADPDNKLSIPVDLVTASGSGLDPHISPAAAEYQIKRIARLRGLSEEKVHALVVKHTNNRQLGLLGEPRVNVLLLNVELDRLNSKE